MLSAMPCSRRGERLGPARPGLSGGGRDIALGCRRGHCVGGPGDLLHEVVGMTFFVEGIPRTKGSWRAVPNPKTGKIVMLHDNPRTKSWQAAVTAAARKAWTPASPTAAPVFLSLAFWLQRPPSQMRKHGALRKGVSVLPIGKNRNDLDKLTRAVFDGLKGVIYEDDSQVYRCEAVKQYVDSRPCVDVGLGVTVLVWAG